MRRFLLACVLLVWGCDDGGGGGGNADPIDASPPADTAIVLDAPDAMGADRSDFTLIPAAGAAVRLPGAAKADVAARIVAFLAGLATDARPR